MRHPQRIALLSAGLLTIGGFVAGCNRDEHLTDSPAEAARQAVGADGKDGTENTTETRRDVIVEKTTKVTDRQTGEVIATEKEVTPVTVEREKKVNTDVNVNVGDTTKTVNRP